MAGYSKIEGCCKQAAADGWEWMWIDSCRIDKTSSSELSETINSMFKWYENANVCYVHLSDVRVGESHPAFDSALSMIKWFTRGWTLQELRAPNTVIFFNRHWVDIGTKTSLQKQLSSITRIGLTILRTSRAHVLHGRCRGHPRERRLGSRMKHIA